MGDIAVFAGLWAVLGRTHWIHLATLAVLLLIFNAQGMYRSRVSLSVLDDLPALLTGLVPTVVVADWLSGIVGTGDSFGASAGRGAGLLVGIVTTRAVAYYVVRQARLRGLIRHNALILGAGHVGLHLAETLKAHRSYGLDPVGFVDSTPRFTPGELPPAPLLGGYDDLTELINRHSVRVVIVAFGGMAESEQIAVLRTCDRLKCEMMFVPRFFELHAITRDVDQVRGLPLVRVRRAPFRSPTWPMKRLFDCVLSGAALVLLSPLLVACAAAVRLESGPGFLFRQERVGIDGRPFMLLKFRSMAPSSDTEAKVTWSIARDDRVGRVGKFLRRTSLDELPQLWNVFIGDMSLIGPRPEREYFVNQFSTEFRHYSDRHRVPVGLSGWAQVHGLRGDTSIEDRAKFDNHYIENWSLWGDTKIILRTVGHLFSRGGS